MILVNYDPIVSDGVVYQLPIYCCHHDHSDVLLLLLFSLSYMQWRGRTALMVASEGGHLDVVNELLKAQEDVNAQDEVVYDALVRKNFMKNLKALRKGM